MAKRYMNSHIDGCVYRHYIGRVGEALRDCEDLVTQHEPLAKAGAGESGRTGSEVATISAWDLEKLGITMDELETLCLKLNSSEDLNRLEVFIRFLTGATLAGADTGAVAGAAAGVRVSITDHQPCKSLRLLSRKINAAIKVTTAPNIR